jgi:hypothetical protein
LGLDDQNIPVLELDARPHRGTKSHPGGQIAMMRGAMAHRFFTLPCGRRVGKTTSIFFLWMEEQARKKGRYTSGYVATDHAKAREFQQAFYQAMGGDPRKNKHSLVTAYSNDQGQDRWVEIGALEWEGPDGEIVALNEGGKYYFWSGQHPHYQAIQGFIFPFDRMVVDEMQLQHPQLVTEVLVPMLMDSDGHLLITGHPKASKPGNHLFQTYYNRGLSDDVEYTQYGSLNMPAEANPFIKVSTIKAGRKACLTKQEEIEEYDGKFVDDSGGVFPNIKAVHCLPVKATPSWWHEFEKDVPLPGMRAWFHRDVHKRKRYVIGVDWAKHRDSTVIMVFDRTTNEQVCVVEIRGEDYEDQIKVVHFLRQKYNKALIHGDHNGVGEAMGERLQRKYKSAYKGHKWSGVSKELYVRRGQIMFKECLVSMMDIPKMKEQFRLFSVIPPKTDDGMGGKFHTARYGHLPNEHDDFPDSFLMLTESLSHAPAREKKEAPTDSVGAPGTLDYVLLVSQGRRQAEGWREVQRRRIGPGGL